MLKYTHMCASTIAKANTFVWHSNHKLSITEITHVQRALNVFYDDNSDWWKRQRDASMFVGNVSGAGAVPAFADIRQYASWGRMSFDDHINMTTTPHTKHIQDQHAPGQPASQRTLINGNSSDAQCESGFSSAHQRIPSYARVSCAAPARKHIEDGREGGREDKGACILVLVRASINLIMMRF